MTDPHDVADEGRGEQLSEPVDRHSVGARPHQRVAASTVATVASSAAIALLGVVVIHELTFTLGSSDYGQLIEVLNIVFIATLFADLGLNTYSGREIRRRPTEAAAILGANLGLRLSLCVVIVPLSIATGLLLYPNAHVTVYEGLVIVALTLPFEAVRAVSLSYYVATIQNYKSAVIGVINQLLYVAGVVIALKLGFGLLGCFVAYFIAMLLTALLAYLAVRRSVAYHPVLVIKSWGSILRNSLGVGMIQVVNALYQRANIVVLSVLTTSATVGIFNVAAAIVTFLIVIPNAYMTSMLPLMVTSPLDGLKELVDSSATYMALVGVSSAVGVSVLAPDLVHLLAPADFAAAAQILAILSLSVVFTCLTSVFTYTAFARDHHHRLLAISIGGLIFNVVLDLALIPHLGARGAAISTDIVEALILVGTYSIFRHRVGAYFGAWGKVLRIVALGGAVGVASKLLLSHVLTVGIERLVVGGVLIAVLLGVAFQVGRCFPAGVDLLELGRRSARRVRSSTPDR